MPELAAKDVPIIIESMRPERLTSARRLLCSRQKAYNVAFQPFQFADVTSHDRQCDRSAVYFTCINLISCVFSLYEK
ncbi:hypothetical protein [Fischerella sp. PCC 9605]|uniref:hypothetical protein n=1 Tax=Fischerella sp. PCC 9605 TaxID=1173024 RepID=UPI0012DE546E|nr:hypothetical protein [Fischerella sp. PCC 9605]